MFKIFKFFPSKLPLKLAIGLKPAPVVNSCINGSNCPYKTRAVVIAVQSLYDSILSKFNVFSNSI